MLSLPAHTTRTKSERNYVLKMLATASNNMLGYKTRTRIGSEGAIMIVSSNGDITPRRSIFDAYHNITLVIWD